MSDVRLIRVTLKKNLRFCWVWVPFEDVSSITKSDYPQVLLVKSTCVSGFASIYGFQMLFNLQKDKCFPRFGFSPVERSLSGRVYLAGIDFSLLFMC